MPWGWVKLQELYQCRLLPPGSRKCSVYRCVDDAQDERHGEEAAGEVAHGCSPAAAGREVSGLAAEQGRSC